MVLNIYYLHTIIFLLVVLFFYRKYVFAQREKYSFRMYKVRDDFVYLVASGEMTETDPVFSHFYKRINSILSMAPSVGIDDILHALFNNSSNFDKSLAKVNKQIERINNSDTVKKEEVKLAIENYYYGVKCMMLSHSSILRIIFILTKRFNPIRMLFEKLIPKTNSISSAYKVTLFAESKAKYWHNKLAN